MIKLFTRTNGEKIAINCEKVKAFGPNPQEMGEEGTFFLLEENVYYQTTLPFEKALQIFDAEDEG